MLNAYQHYWLGSFIMLYFPPANPHCLDQLVTGTSKSVPCIHILQKWNLCPWQCG